MKGRAIKYSDEELSFIRSHCTMVRKEMVELLNNAFGSSHELKNINALCKRKGWMTGRDGCFKKGDKPSPNAGPKGPNKTSFKKGSKPKSWRPVGSERVNKNGYLVRKISDTGVKKKDWVLLHRYVWEQRHGKPVPDGHIVIFVDGDIRNFDLENLRLISRSDNAIINKYGLRNVDDLVKPSAITYGQLVNKTRQTERAA